MFSYLLRSDRGRANGVAPLNSSSEIPVGYIPASVRGVPEPFTPAGTYPTTYGGGPITEGMSFRILADGAVGAQTVQASDILTALSDTPGQTDANWHVTNGNVGPASETQAGIAETLTLAETNTGTDDSRILTIAKWLASTFWATVTGHIASTSNPHSVTKTQVGLSNADNTSDANKPVSTAQATAIGLKLNSSAVSAFGLTLVDDTTAALARATLGVVRDKFLQPDPGGLLTWVDATSVSIAAGSYMDSTGAVELSWGSPLVIDFDNANGAGGLDTGSETVSTIYYPYVIGDSTGVNPPVGIFSINATAPTTYPSGYDVCRRMGHTYNNAASNLWEFKRTGGQGRFLHRWMIPDTDQIILNAGAQTTATAVDTSALGLAPPRSCTLQLWVDAAVQNAKLVVGSGSVVDVITVGTNGIGMLVEFPSDASGIIYYRVVNLGSVTIMLQAFWDVL